MRKRLVIYLIWGFVLISKILSSQCGVTDTLIAIPDDEKAMEIQLIIAGIVNNDLSDPAQGVCGVTLKYNHTKRSELTIDLISPIGQKVRLVGPYVPNANTLFGQISWNISFVRCSQLASPDVNKDKHFNSTNDWFSNGVGYTGVYYPNDYCLESFDKGSVNGTWTFVVHDHSRFQKGNLLGFSIEFCDGTTTDCDLCDSYAGFFTDKELSICEDDNESVIEFNHSFDNFVADSDFYNFEYLVYKNNVFLERSDNPDLDFNKVGKYNICGLSYHKIDSTRIIDLAVKSTKNVFFDSIENVGSPFCADLTDTCFVVNILPVDTTIIDTTICLGDTILFDNQKIFENGKYFLNSNENCDSSYVINVNVINLNAKIEASDTLMPCDKDIELIGKGYLPGTSMTFKWSDSVLLTSIDTVVNVYKNGYYEFILSQGICCDTAGVTILSNPDKPILEFDLNDIDCEHDSVTLSVTSTNSTLDSVVWTNNNDYFGSTIKTGVAGTYVVQAFGINSCKTTKVIEIEKDTIVPYATILANDITCIQDTAFIDFDSNDSLREVFWTDLSSYTEDVFVLDSGVYHVRYKGVNGCVNTDSIEVFEYTDSLIYTITSDTLNCLIGNKTIDFNSTEGDLSFIWITPRGDSLFTEDIAIDTQGIYEYTITNKYGCITKGHHEVIKNEDKPIINFAQDTFYLSCGVPVHLNPHIDVSIISVFWVGPGNFTSSIKDPIVTIEGTYYINIIGSNGCSSIDTVVVISDSSIPEPLIYTDTINCLDSFANLHVVCPGNYSFKWEDPLSFTYLGDIMKGVKNIGGFYYLTITDNVNNCESEFYTYVNIDTIKPTFEIIPSNLLDCRNDSLILKYKTDFDIETTHWESVSVDSYKDTLIIFDEGIYYARITTSNGCYSDDSILIEKQEVLNVENDTFYLNCTNGLKVELGVQNPKSDFTYKWNGAGFYSEESNPEVTKEGVYKVIVKNTDCIDSAEMLVLYDTVAPVVSITYDSILTCNKNFAVVSVEIIGDTMGYYWEGPNFLSNNLLDTVFAEGRYIFYSQLINGCVSSDTINIKKSEDFPEIKAYGDTINCNVEEHELTIDADISGDYSSLYWEGPNSYSSIQLKNVVVDSGTYYIYVNTLDGCNSVDSVFVKIDLDKPNVQIGSIDTITCYKETIDIDLKIKPDNYSIKWKGPFSFSSDKKDVRINNGGKYVFEVKSENGCVREDTIDVIINKLKPLPIIESENLNCCSSKKTIYLNSTAAKFDQKWIFPDGSIDLNRDIIIADSGTYKVEMLDLDNGCKSIDSVFIGWDSIKPNIYIQDYFLNCDSSLIEMITFSDMPDVEFKWYGPGFYVEGDKAYTNIAGSYYIIASGRNCCSVFKSFEVKEKFLYPKFDSYGGVLSCKNDSVKIKAIGVDDDLSYEWSGPNGFNSKEKTPFVYDEGDYTLRVIGQNKCDSSSIVSVILDTIRPQIEIEFLDSLFCSKREGEIGVSITNQENVPYSYSWSTNNGKIVKGKYTKDLFVKGGGTYILEVTNTNNGCLTVDSITVVSNFYDLDSIGVTITPPSCYGYSDGKIQIDTVFGGNSPYSYSLDNYWFSNNKSYNSKEAGVFSLYVKDIYGCVLDTNIIVPDGADIQLQLGVDKNNIFLGDSVTITALINAKNGIETYNWKPEFLFSNQEDSIQVIKPQKSNSISLSLIDSNGCEIEDVIWLEVKGKPDVYIPNIFTPNSDGVNDYFYIRTGIGVKNIKSLKIFDNWGEKLFDKNNLKLNVPIDGWNGTFNGKEVSSGVYVYLFELELEDGAITRVAGDITIIK